MTITIPAPDGIDAAGRSAVIWVPSIEDINAPTVAEITAGTHLSCAIAGFEPTVSQNTVTSRKYCEKQSTETPGIPAYSIPPLRVLDDPQGDDTNGQYDYLDDLYQGAKGFIVNRRGLDMDDEVVSGQKCTIYPVELGAPLEVPLDLTADSQKFEIEYAVFVTGEVVHGAIIGGVSEPVG